MLKVPVICIPNFLSSEELKYLNKAFDEGEKVYERSEDAEGNLDYALRHCRTVWHYDPDFVWELFQRFKPYDEWEYQLYDPREDESASTVFLLEYKENQFTGWHVDGVINDNPLFPDNKMTMVIQLADPEDYEGGEFRLFPDYLNQSLTEHNGEQLKAGSAIIIPAFVVHEVTPVTNGTRRSAAIFFSGPDFK